jgi:hypothetical protein
VTEKVGVGGRFPDVVDDRRVLSNQKKRAMALQVEIQHLQPPLLASQEGDQIGIGVDFGSERRQTLFKIFQHSHAWQAD